MEIRYLYNSGFCITDDNMTIVIDYYLDSCESGQHIVENGVVGDDILMREGRLYVLSSHSHNDHFNKTILNWSEKKSDIIYVFSKDIRRRISKFKNGKDIQFLRKGDVYEDEHILIKAFGSTDCGISFLIKIKDKNEILFHAGDLNNWHWMEESSAEEAREAQDAYLSELGQIAAEVDYVDVAMFPIDPRLGAEYMLGGKQFLDKIKCGMFVPMHFGEKYSASWEFESYARSKGSNFAKITARGALFIY